MTAEELLEQVKKLGVLVTLDCEDLVLRPKSRLTPDLVDQLRAHKAELRGLVELQGWPEASRKAVQEFRVPEARLFPFIGELVGTPEGESRLVAVLANRAEVAGLTGLSVFLPSEVRPPEMERLHEEPFEAVH